MFVLCVFAATNSFPMALSSSLSVLSLCTWIVVMSEFKNVPASLCCVNNFLFVSVLKRIF